ncbi:hypothetical protein B7P43_G15769 [Cryptotermes secundus]|uniref:Uncharacterized protein n=1 Tax=Cryptotermes secundus TaxID=105785 RepID=A0A2J7QRA5_9NEOP|nr:hypothetical protein B7P43_G15769 [Cryptotermes secundus]
MCQNVVHAADPSQIRKDGRGVWKNFPCHLCNYFQCEVSSVGTSVVMQDHNVLSWTLIAQCTTELVQRLDITSSIDRLPRFQEFGQNKPLCIEEDCAHHLRS